MISTIYSSSPYIQVASPPMPYVQSGPMSGQMRWNTQINSMEVCDGHSWTAVGGGAGIHVSEEFNNIMAWAKTEMHRSSEIKRLAATSPTVADALANYELAAEKLQVIIALVEEQEAS